MRSGLGRVDVAACEDGVDGDAGGFDGFASAFAAVYEDEGEGHVTTFAADFLDGFEGGATGGDGVIDDDDGVAGFEIPFDEAAAAVGFGLFADGEHLEVGTGAGCADADGEGDGVGSHGEAADGGRLDAEARGFRADEVPADFAEGDGSVGVEGREAGVAVEIAFPAGGEGEVAVHDGLAAEDAEELLARVHDVRGIG